MDQKLFEWLLDLYLRVRKIAQHLERLMLIDKSFF